MLGATLRKWFDASREIVPWKPADAARLLMPVQRVTSPSLHVTWMKDGSVLALKDPAWIEVFEGIWGDLEPAARSAFNRALRERTAYYARKKLVPQNGAAVDLNRYRPPDGLPFPATLKTHADLAVAVLYWEGGLRQALDAVVVGREVEAKQQRESSDPLETISRRLLALIRLQGLILLGQSGVYYGFGETSGMGAVRGLTFTATGAQRIFLNEKDRPVGVTFRVSTASVTVASTVLISPKSAVPTAMRVTLNADVVGSATPVLVVPPRQSLYANPSVTDVELLIVEVDVLRPDADDGVGV